MPYFLILPKFLQFLSLFAPIEIEAIALGVVVISRHRLTTVIRNHEMIHYHQYRELGYLLFMPIYLWDFCVGYVRYRNFQTAYKQIRMEQEAYACQGDASYLLQRKPFAWFHEFSV